MRQVLLFVMMIGAAGSGWAQGTKLWTVDRFDELERGTSHGVAIRNDGSLAPAPDSALLYVTGGNYIWSVAADAAGNAYIGTGGTASGSADVIRVAPDGKAEKIFAARELGVQAVRVGPDGSVFVATSPDGRVYRLAKGGAAAVVFDPAATPEKSKYLWDLAVSPRGEVYVAAGAPAAVYRVASGKTGLLFKTADQHVRTLLLSRSGMLWAGTDGGGIVYRIDPRLPASRPFAVLAAGQREITSLAEDDAGAIYAAGVGSKGGASLPPLPVTGAAGIAVTFLQPGSAGAVNNSTVIPEGSQIYKIASDGSPLKLLTLKDDVVYGLVVHAGALLVSTGNRGAVYRVDLATETAGRYADLGHLEASQGAAIATTADGGVLIGTSNSGKLYRIGGDAVTPSYVSEVFDAGGFARWGRAEVRADGAAYELSVRVGNVASPLEGWSDWVRFNDGAGKLPDGRFAQWKVDFTGVGSIASVALNYLPRNLAPIVDDVAVQLGARVAPGAAAAVTTVQVNFPVPPASGMLAGIVPVTADAGSGPLTAQRDRSAITVRWLAHDDNGDDLLYSVWFRGVGEKNFHLLKGKISDRYYSFDEAALPDGPYVLKIVASDAPSHTESEALTGERVSGVFVVDTTPPVLTPLHLTMSTSTMPPSIQVEFAAQDATSPIEHAEYSLDAGPWQYVEPTGNLSDSTTEHYAFAAALPGDYRHERACAAGGDDQHVLTVRVYDRYENIGSGKAVTARSCPGTPPVAR